jgi:hypothetical protein
MEDQEKSTFQKRLSDLLCCAFEGGSNYWYQKLAPLKETSKAAHASDRFYEDLVKHGFTLFDAESERTCIVEPKSFKSALKLMETQCPGHYADFISKNEDAATGDVYLQLLVFGDVLYG